MLGHVFHPSMHEAARTAPSYWEASVTRSAHDRVAGDFSVDVAVIGGGYTGLSTALHLARDHSIEVAVLEAGAIGFGASGRNAGFACLPATKLSVRQMVARYGLEETRAFHAAQAEGIAFTAQLMREEGIDADRTGDGVVIVAQHPRALAEMRAQAEEARRLFGFPFEIHSREAFARNGHDGPEQHGAVRTWPGYAIHPLKFALGLAQAAERHGARLYAHSAVLSWEKRDGRHRLRTAGGTISAARVVLATNGYTPDGLHPAFDRRTVPAISNIIVTRPLSEAELSRHGFHDTSAHLNNRHLLSYYRKLPDNRILLGERGDTTGTPEDGARIRAQLVRRLGEMFPEWRDIEPAYFWRGLVCMTRKLAPSLGRLEDDPSVHYAFGYHANGVNSAPWAGRAVARAIAGSNSGEAVTPAVWRGLPARMPPLGAWSRRLALRAAFLLYQWQDRRAERG